MAVALTEADARRSLVAACRVAGIPGYSAELVRLGSNAVFRVDGHIVGRVSPDASFAANAAMQVRVARWLQRIEYPAVRAVEVPQPIEATGSIVTFWKAVGAGDDYAPIAEVARLIRWLHDLEAPSEITLTELHPFETIGDESARLAGLSAPDRDFLLDRIEWARTEFSRLPYALPRGLIHGDANVGNVLADEAGNPVLIDLDSFAVGPREWDLIQTALFYDRFGWHTREEYETFVDVYGYDVMQWEGYSTLADIREIAMTSWLSGKAADSASTAAEAAKRIDAIRTGASRRDWGAY